MLIVSYLFHCSGLMNGIWTVQKRKKSMLVAGIQGFDMHINSNGDAQGNYTLLSLQEVDPVLDVDNPNYYPLNYGLAISADFVHDFASDLPLLRFKRDIQWPTGFAPRDEPVCGFHGKMCKKGIFSNVVFEK